MPAWGVRTALTALRSFMAEKGTAGQIGGLEASDEVRKRLAKESREWRCENCKKTNEMVMREWWRICQEAGINVNEENLGLEGLPDGMNLVARDPNARQEEKTTSTQSDDKASSQPQPQQQIPTIIQPSPQAHPEQQSTPILHSVLPAPSPSAEAVQASAEARLTPSELAAIANSASTMHNRPMASIHSGPIAAANAALSQSGSSQPRPLQQIADSQRTSQHHTHQPIQARGQGANQTITIDRAIAGVFLALCLMVLKKIFYPAGSTTAFGVVGRDEFYLPGR
jgi:ubiquitin-conjugating enzyme E2 J1